MISFKSEDGKFNFRVGAIIISADRKKVLLHTIKGYGFYLLPGGRVGFGEDSVRAIKRELKEEIGLENFDLHIRFYLEDFFTFNNEKYHEISYNYIIYLNENNNYIEKWQDFFGVEGEKYQFKWVDIDEIDNFTLKPAILKDIIKNHDGGFQHLILHEN